MTFSYNLSTDIGKIRLNIGDTDSSTEVFSDEEIQAILTSSEDDVNQATGKLLLIEANDAARLAKVKKAGNYSEDTTKIAENLRKNAAEWFERGIIPWDETMEQTFGPVVNPYDGRGEKEFIAREDLRDS